jgi:hypothetical protein
LALTELCDVGGGPTADEFFSRNFLLIFTALNRFGWLVDDPLDPNCTSEGREGLKLDFASVEARGELFTETSRPSGVEVSCMTFNGLEPSQLGSKIPPKKSGPSFCGNCGERDKSLSMLAIDASSDACPCNCRLPV